MLHPESQSESCFPSNTSRNKIKNATRLQTTLYNNVPVSQMAIPSFLWVTQSGLASPSLTNRKQTAKLSCVCLVAARAHQAQSQPITEHSLASSCPWGGCVASSCTLSNLTYNQHILVTSRSTELVSTVTQFSPWHNGYYEMQPEINDIK